jgi:hypothetical protein
MTARERSLLKRLAERLQTDRDLLTAVLADPAGALAAFGLRPAQVAAAGSLALMLSHGGRTEQHTGPDEGEGWW